MYIVFWCIIFLFKGAICQILDELIGARIYKIFYNLTHEKPLPKDTRLGFIAHRGTKIRCFWALVGSTFVCWLFVFSDNESKMTKFAVWLLGIPLITIGFYFGPALRRLWKNRDAFFKRLDEIERGESQYQDKVRQTILKIRSWIRDVIRKISGYSRESQSVTTATETTAPSPVPDPPIATPISPQAPTATPADPKPQEENPAELIRKYVEGKN